jgi:periplasmic protein TonB
MFSGLGVTQEHPARRWTTLASFSLQATLIAIALVVPLFQRQNLPEAFANRRIFVPMSNGQVPTQTNPTTKRPDGTNTYKCTGRIHAFADLREKPAERKRPGAGASSSRGAGIGTGPDLGPPVFTNSTILPPNPSPARKTRISTVMEGNLIHRVEPQYPVIARQIRMQGAVVLKAVISREGAIEQVEIVSGQSVLARAAFDAVRQWKYRPYYLNNEPIEVETQITVNFVLDR